MRNLLFIVLFVFNVLLAQADQDLTISEKRWQADGTGFSCGAYTEKRIEAPGEFSDYNVDLKYLFTDRTLDNVLILGTFVEDDSLCRYSAVLFADNEASTIKLIESKVFSRNSEAKCGKGKLFLDAQLSFNRYEYWGHPHHATIMLNYESAKAVCGEKTQLGIDFVVSKFLGKR